jgi:nicotinamide riboside transporter PnuC
MAAVVSLGYVGLIAGPAVVGFAAQATTLAWALGMVAAFSLAVAAFAGAARVADRAD